MTITAKQYAIALIESLRGKGKEETKKMIKEFVVILAGNKALDKENEIINKFFDLWQSEQGILEVDVISARKLSEASKKIIKDFLRQSFKMQKVIIEEKFDKKILGGIIVRHKDKIWDMSMMTRLERMREEMCR